MALPIAGYLSDTERTNAEMQAALEDQRDVVYVGQIESVTDLRAFAGTANDQQASVVMPDDKRMFVRWDAVSTAADDGVTVFAVTGVATGRWIRVTDVVNGTSATRDVPEEGGVNYWFSVIDGALMLEEI